MAKLGRDPDHLKILPGAFVVVGDSLEEAREKRAKLDSLVHYDSAIASLSIALGHDASRFDPDGPLPEIPETNASKSGRERAIELAQAREPDGAPACPAPRRLCRPGAARHARDDRRPDGGVAGDRRLRRLQRHVPVSCRPGSTTSSTRVVPELQRRGIFRREYEGTTLRENLGLPRPENRFFSEWSSGSAPGSSPGQALKPARWRRPRDPPPEARPPAFAGAGFWNPILEVMGSKRPALG